MKIYKEFNDITVAEAQILENAIVLWQAIELMQTPNAIKHLPDDVDPNEFEKGMLKIYNKKKLDSKKILKTVESVISYKTTKEIEKLIGE